MFVVVVTVRSVQVAVVQVIDVVLVGDRLVTAPRPVPVRVLAVQHTPSRVHSSQWPSWLWWRWPSWT